MFPQSQDLKPCLLTSLQALSMALLNAQQSCPLGGASDPLLGILPLPLCLSCSHVTFKPQLKRYSFESPP